MISWALRWNREVGRTGYRLADDTLGDDRFFARLESQLQKFLRPGLAFGLFGFTERVQHFGFNSPNKLMKVAIEFNLNVLVLGNFEISSSAFPLAGQSLEIGLKCLVVALCCRPKTTYFQFYF